MVLHTLRTIPEAARLSGVSKSVLYVWAAEGRLAVKCVGRGSKPGMRTTLAWVRAAIDALPNLGG